MYRLEEEKEVLLGRMYLFCLKKTTKTLRPFSFLPLPFLISNNGKGGKQLFLWIDRFGGKGTIFTTRWMKRFIHQGGRGEAEITLGLEPGVLTASDKHQESAKGLT